MEQPAIPAPWYYDLESLALYVLIAVAILAVILLLRWILAGIGRLFRRKTPASPVPLDELSEIDQLRALWDEVLIPPLSRPPTSEEDKIAMLEAHKAKHRKKNDRERIIAVINYLAERKSNLILLTNASYGDKETARLQGAVFDTHCISVVKDLLVIDRLDVVRMKHLRDLSRNTAEYLLAANTWERQHSKDAIGQMQTGLKDVLTTLAANLKDQLEVMRAKLNVEDFKSAERIEAISKQLEAMTQIATNLSAPRPPRPANDRPANPKKPGEDPKKKDEGQAA